MQLEVSIHWDAEATVWIAVNEEIGLILESGSLDALLERVKIAIVELISIQSQPHDAVVSFEMQRTEVVHGGI